MKDNGDAIAQKPICGIVMPISAADGCSERHWQDVFAILEASAADAGFEAKMVSDEDYSSVIQSRIISGLYAYPIVVCDVSTKNPNVMFELGMRLAFDKPTIIVKDDSTGYSFDINIIEHIDYPRDLRYATIVDFQKRLAEKIKGTYDRSLADGYTTFLKHFGGYRPARLEQKELTDSELIIEELSRINRSLRSLRTSRTKSWSQDLSDLRNIDFVVSRSSLEKVQGAVARVSLDPGIYGGIVTPLASGRYRVNFTVSEEVSLGLLHSHLADLLGGSTRVSVMPLRVNHRQVADDPESGDV